MAKNGKRKACEKLNFVIEDVERLKDKACRGLEGFDKNDCEAALNDVRNDAIDAEKALC